MKYYFILGIISFLSFSTTEGILPLNQSINEFHSKDISVSPIENNSELLSENEIVGTWLHEEKNNLLFLKSDNTYQSASINEYDETAVIEEGEYHINEKKLTITPNQKECNGSRTFVTNMTYSLKSNSTILVLYFRQNGVDYPSTLNKVGKKEVRTFKQAMADKEVIVCI